MQQKYTKTFKCGCGSIRITDIFEGRVLTVGIGRYSNQKKNGRAHLFAREQFFLQRSGSTYEELLQRSRFVTEYVKSYPDWVERAILDPVDKMGISLSQFFHLYHDFMSTCLRDEGYKKVFELMLVQLGGVIASEADTYLTRATEDHFSYGLISLDLNNIDLVSYTKDYGLDLDEELSRSMPQFSEKTVFLPIIRSARRKIEAYLALDEMYLTMAVPEVSDLSVSELILKCTYDLLSLMEYGDNYIDSTHKKDRTIRAVTAMQTLSALKHSVSHFSA